MLLCLCKFVQADDSTLLRRGVAVCTILTVPTGLVVVIVAVMMAQVIVACFLSSSSVIAVIHVLLVQIHRRQSIQGQMGGLLECCQSAWK